MVFSKEVDTGTFTRKWGDKDIPRVASYSFLGIEFVNNGSLDRHVQILMVKGKKLNHLHSVVRRFWYVRAVFMSINQQKSHRCLSNGTK